MAGPEEMRTAMADYVRTVHQAYLSQAALQAPAVRGRMPLVAAGRFTVVAAGVQNLHVLATTESLPPPRGPEVEMQDELDGMAWRLRFFDPVVVPALGLIDESGGPAGDRVRSALGVTTYLYHLVVQPGGQLTGHHAGHAGAGLANAHIAEARDFESLRAYARGRERLVDEMEGAALAGLVTAHALLARQIAPWSEEVERLAAEATPEPAAVRRALLEALRGPEGG
jgi:hypothetical protein